MSATGGLVSEAYEARVRAGELEPDREQRALVAKLDALLRDLERARLGAKSSALGWLFGTAPRPEAVRGLYVHGAVGRGKTMLMDLFHAALPGTKRRAHFHDFMADVHMRIHVAREQGKLGRGPDGDPIPIVARAIRDEARVLCFDEFAITDVADAMVLARLFERLFDMGVTLVATSNVAPEGLYRDGLNRRRFEPFIARLQERCEVIDLDAAGRDYRRGGAAGSAASDASASGTGQGASDGGETGDAVPVYAVAGDATGASRPLERAWRAYASGSGSPDTIRRGGRTIVAPRAVQTDPPGREGSAAWFSFDALCGAPLGAGDYRAIADRYRTVVVSGVPVFTPEARNEAKRFINLVDTFYDRGTRLVVGAAAEPDALRGGLQRTEAFEFDRTASRLHEMRAAPWRDRTPEPHRASLAGGFAPASG